MIQKPRVSVVKYLNTVPLIWGMLHGEQQGKFDLSFTTPACCADALARGQVDVGIIPSIEYQRIPGACIVGGVSIASKALVKSVLLLSNKPVEQVERVALDNSSRTSVALVTILLRTFYGRNAEFTPFEPDADEMLRCNDAALVIGDPALAYRGPAPYVYDLASEWRKFTGLPFVFALWVGISAIEMRRLREHFEGSRDYGVAHIDEIAREYAPKYRLAAADVKIYLTENIDYSLDSENMEGLRLFYRLAHEAGLIPESRDLEFG